jgi:hypothetical protein
VIRPALPFFFLFLGFAVFLEAQNPGSNPVEQQNRKILEGILRDRGIPYIQRGESLLIPGGAAALVIAAPLAYPGEAPLEAGPGNSPGNGEEKGPGSKSGADPLRFAIPLSFFPAGENSPGGPVPAIAFLGGADPWAELGGLFMENPLTGEPAEENPALSGGTGRRAVVFLDIPRESGGGELVFGLKGTPPLGDLLSALRVCETTELPWSFDRPFLASGKRPAAGAENPEAAANGSLDGIVIRLGDRVEPFSGENGGPDFLGEFLRRYAEDLEKEDGPPERNYLAFRFRGKLFIIAELPLILGFLGLGLFYFCGLLFLPAAKKTKTGRHSGGTPAVPILWLCLISLTAAALYRLSVYPLLAPALLLAFAGRSLPPPGRRICLGTAVLYLGAALLFLRGV